MGAIDAMSDRAADTRQAPRRRRAPGSHTLVALIATLGLAGCVGDLLDVRDPDIVPPDDLTGEAGLATLRAGALGDFARALGGSAAGHGGTPALIHYSDVFTDAFTYSGTFPTRREPDQRSIQERNGSMLTVYTGLHRARAAAANTAATIEAAGASGDFRLSEMQSVVAFTFILFGEHYCAGVPFSTAAPGGELIFGQPLTTAQMFDSAVVWADRALASAGSAAPQASLAAVAKGRALLNLARFPEAATAVTAVPADFTYLAEFSANTRQEEIGLYLLTRVDRQFSVSDGEGGGLPYRSANDPRVPWTQIPGELGQDGVTPFYRQMKYDAPDAPVVFASGIEARLIEAEAALQANDLTTFGNIHTALRATVLLGAVDPTAMTATEREDFHFQERAFWLWLTAHRFGDLRRLARQYGRPVESVFPSGPYFKGGTFGVDVNFPIPIEEQNNPNFTGCIDRNP